MDFDLPELPDLSQVKDTVSTVVDMLVQMISSPPDISETFSGLSGRK